MSCVIRLYVPVSSTGCCRVLDLQLKELVEDGLVTKMIYPELPPRSEYSITALGMTLIPIIDAMIDWGNRNAALFEKKYGPKATNLTGI